MPNLSPVAEDEASRLRASLTQEYLSDPKNFQTSMLRKREWAAVPFEERITQDQAEHLAVAAKAESVRQGVAVTTDPQSNPEVVRVELTTSGILDFDANCMLRPFLLVAGEEKFALLEEGDYYFILAGPTLFLEKAIRKSIPEARRDFQEYANHPSLPPRTRRWLVGISDRYWVADPPPTAQAPLS